MAVRKPRRAQPRHRTKPQGHHRHPRKIRGCVRVPAGATDAAGQVGRAFCLDGFHRAATAGALDQADDRQAEIVRHFLGHQGLCGNRGIRRAAAYREIVADHDHGAPVHPAAAEHAIGGRHVRELAVLVIFTAAGYGADLVKAFGIEQLVDALAHGEPALVALPLDLVNAAHLARKRLPPGEFVEFRLPVHSGAPFATPPVPPPQAGRVGWDDRINFHLHTKLPWAM